MNPRLLRYLSGAIRVVRAVGTILLIAVLSLLDVFMGIVIEIGKVEGFLKISFQRFIKLPHVWFLTAIIAYFLIIALATFMSYQPLPFHFMRRPLLVQPYPWKFVRAILRRIRRDALFVLVTVSILIFVGAFIGFLAVFCSSIHDCSDPSGSRSLMGEVFSYIKEKHLNSIAVVSLIAMGNIKLVALIIILAGTYFYAYSSDRRGIVDWKNLGFWLKQWLLIRFSIARIWLSIKALATEHPFVILVTPFLDILVGISICLYVIYFHPLVYYVFPWKSDSVLISLLIFKFSLLTAWVAPVLVLVSNHVPLVLKGSAQEVNRVIRSLDDHVIIAGFGRLGPYLVREVFLRYFRFFKDPKKWTSRQYLRDILLLPHWNIIEYVNQRNRIKALWAKAVVVDRSTKYINEISGEIGGSRYGTVRAMVDIGEMPYRSIYVPAVLQDVNDQETRNLLKYPDARLFFLMINDSESIFEFLQWLLEEMKEREVAAVIGVDRTMFYSVFPLWELPNVYYVYPNLERGRLIAREVSLLIHWILQERGKGKIKVLILESGKQMHFFLEGLYAEFENDFDKISFTVVTTGMYEKNEISRCVEKDLCKKIPDIPEYVRTWEHQIFRSVEREKYVKEIEVVPVPFFNFRRIYALIENREPDIVLITHQNAFENINILETVVQVARAWSSHKSDHFPVVVVGTGEGEIASVKRLLVHLKAQIRKKIQAVDFVTSLNYSLVSHGIVFRFNKPLPRSVSHLAIPVDEELLNEIGAISEALYSEAPSVEVHVCFGNSEAPGAMLLVLAALAGYKVPNQIPRFNKIPDFHICGSARPSLLPDADIFFFEGHAHLVNVKRIEMPNHTWLLSLTDSSKWEDSGKLNPNDLLRSLLHKDLGFSSYNERYSNEFQERCAKHVACPIATYEQIFLQMPQKDRENIVNITKRGYLFYTKRDRESSVETPRRDQEVRARFVACGGLDRYPGSMALLLGKFLGVQLEVREDVQYVLNANFTKSQRCLGSREYKRILGTLERGVPLDPGIDVLNGLQVIVPFAAKNDWEKYLTQVLDVEVVNISDRIPEEGKPHNLMLYVYFSEKCRRCPYFPLRSPRPQLCKIWHPELLNRGGGYSVESETSLYEDLPRLYSVPL